MTTTNPPAARLDSAAERRAREVEEQLSDEERFSLIVSVLGQVPGSDAAADRHPLIPDDVTNMSAGYTPGVPRLGVPAIQSSDASTGVTNPGYRPDDEGATSFPSLLALGVDPYLSAVLAAEQATGARATTTTPTAHLREWDSAPGTRGVHRMTNPLDLSQNEPAAVENPLELEPPAPTTDVVVHEPEKVGGVILVDADTQQKHAETAKKFLDELLDTPLHSPEFQTKLAQLTKLGEGTMQQAADSSNRMLQRPAAAAAGSGADPASRTGASLAELRQIVTELDPKRHDLTGTKKILKFLPGGSGIQRYFQKYESAQEQLDAITKTLKGGQDELRMDNAAIQTERDALWAALEHLANYAVLARHLGDGLEQRIAGLRSDGKTDDASTLESDALFYVRQRHQDLMTQMAVSIQGYLALDVVKKNNTELIKGVDRALDTTLAALRVAVIVSQALGQQKIVLAQIDALNATTSDMIVATSELLRSQGADIQRHASQATVDPAQLQQAFDNVFQAMDEIDRYKAEATKSMKQTVQVLEGQVSRARLQLERSHSSDASTADPGGS